jgi:hypothetical protein
MNCPARCHLGGCNEHLVKLVSVINPADVMTFSAIEIANIEIGERDRPAALVHRSRSDT